jgi:hypothetical protein
LRAFWHFWHPAGIGLAKVLPHKRRPHLDRTVLLRSRSLSSARVLEKAGLRFERRAVVDGLEILFYGLPRSAFQPDG